MGTSVRSARIDYAEQLVAVLLAGLDERWKHTVAVVERAQALSRAVPAADQELLIVAAWLHDIGYAPELHETGFHPLDGARYLDRAGWEKRLTSLVAHHSGASWVADVRGLGREMTDFPAEISPLSDALTYADQTVGPYGREFTVEQRMEEMLHRHGPGSAQAQAHPLRGPYLLAAAERVRNRLQEAD